MDTVAELDELRSAVHRDPRRVAEAAQRLVTGARMADDQATLSRALAVLGRARRSLGEIDLAGSDLTGAVSAATAAGDSELLADAHIGLAGVLSFAGRTPEAFSHLDLADQLGSDRLRAYAALQRGVIEQRIGHLAEALTAYDRALPTLRRIGAHIDLALVLMNRGVINTQSGACAVAVADLSEAGQLFQTEQHSFGLAQTQHGLGWAYARAGDLPRALGHLDRATDLFQQLGHRGLEVDVDRVEVLLSAGLITEAGSLAVDTARALHAAGNHSQAAETWLLCAQARLLDGDPAGGLVFAEQARVLFAEHRAVGWERLASLAVFQCGPGAGQSGPADRDSAAEQADQLRVLAEQLDRAGNARGAVTALALASLAVCRAGSIGPATALAAQCAARAGRLGLFELRMLAGYATATCAVGGGEPARARRQVRLSLIDLERHRASLTSTDARASVAVHAARLADLGLQLALRDGSAPALLEWMERARAGRPAAVSPRPPGDDALTAELTELRTVAAQTRAAEVDGSDTSELLARQSRLERTIRDRHLRAGADRAGGEALDSERTGGARSGQTDLARRPPTGPQLRAALDGGTLVEFAEIDGRLIAVVVDPVRSRVADLGPITATTSVVETIMAALRAGVAPGRPTDHRAVHLSLLRRALTALDKIMGGLWSRGGRSRGGAVVLVVPPALHTVPWHLTPSLVGRPVVLAPSATWWYETVSRPPPTAGQTLLVAGPRLVEADREVLDIAAGKADATVLTGSAATVHAVTSAMATAGTVHLACHGRIRRSNPLWSTLELADGPLYVYDLEGLAHTPPFVVLSGCQTGVGVRAGDDLLGLASALLDHGTRTLVAAVCALPDTAATRHTMVDLHRRISAGATPATALAELASVATDAEQALLAACLTCFGIY